METGGSSEIPSQTKKGKTKTKTLKKPEASSLKQKSPAEFFAENKNIAGFDNQGKCLYTTVRELVENSLDSAESISELPVVEVTIEEIVKSKFNSMIGLIHRERVDKALYDDYETEKAREKRLAKAARDQEIQEKNVALGKKVKEPSAVKAMKGRGEASFYRVTCKDNGRGMPHDDIPNMLGRVLSGTKYGLKQTRGKFGLGAKMALIWSKMSTGLPIEIKSAMQGQAYLSFCRLDIDIHRNTPHIHLHEKQENKDRWHGAEIQVVIEGNWTTYRSKILHYMRQMAVITPYAQFLFKFVSETTDKNVTIRFARRTDVMPEVPEETKYHPSAVDLLLIKRLIAETSKQNLLQFLQHEFVNIGKAHAERLIGEMGPDFNPKMPVKSLTSQQIVRIHQLFRQAKFDDPSGDCLTPAGEYNLRLGIIKELHPDMVATYSGSAQVFEGHPFIVEAGVSVGGKDVKHGLNIFRFANRIPLLFEQGADVVTRTALRRINWSSYKINQNQDKIGVFVSIVSTKIPFKGTGKEYIGDDISEIASAVKCCAQLKSKIVKKIQAREQQERKRNLSRYIPDAANAIYDVLKEMAQLHASKKKRYEDEDAEILRQVCDRSLTTDVLKEKLAKHVEQVDYEMALEYATQTGISEEPKEGLHLQALDPKISFIDLHSPVFVFRSWKHPVCHRSQTRLSLGLGSKASTGVQLQYAVENEIQRSQVSASFPYTLTKMSKPLPQIAIIGAGIFVKTQYIPRLSEISHLVTVKYIWSRSKESAESAMEIARKEFPGVESKWGDEGFDEIIKDDGIIGVAVVLAAQLQVDISTKLLKAGKHVLQAIEEASSALSVFKSSLCSPSYPLVWAVAENYRFETAFLEGRKLVSELGDLMSVQLIVEGSMNSSNPYFSSSWRRNFNGGFILDMGVHMIAGLRMLVGCEVTSVSAFTNHVDVTLPPPDNVSSILQLENGCSGVFVMSVSTRSPKIYWRVVGLKGTVQVERGIEGGRHGYLVLKYDSNGQCTSSFYPFCGVSEELKAFIHDTSKFSLEKVSDHEPDHRLSYAEGARDVAVLEAMLESGQRQGVMVPVKRIED
ncbi:DNA topoisomerase 6 subunit B-like protein [Drosera capensis]